MKHEKYLITVDVHSEVSSGWDTWIKVDTEEFKGDDFDKLKTKALDFEDKWKDYHTEISYYRQSIEMKPTLVLTEIDYYGNTQEDNTILSKESRKLEYLKLKEEFENEE